ncbi:MAG: phage virion morphogenesis protein [Betaproteobacteria bacterium]|nr:phage virion morphogenesis protein [Betaproteobacteria bacterium]
MKILIEVRDEQVTRLLSRLSELGTNLRPAMNAIGEAVVNSTRLRFAESAAPDGSAWKPLAFATLIARSRRGRRGSRIVSVGSGQPLLDTGQLRNSISFGASDREVVIGTPLSWSRVHQFGGQAGRGHKVRIPARPFLGISQEDRAEITAILADHLGSAA